MSSVGMKYVQDGFFDRAGVKKELGGKVAKVIRKSASEIQRKAKRSIKKARKKTISQMDTDELIAYYAVSDARKKKISNRRFYAIQHGMTEGERKRYWGIYFDAIRTGRKPYKPYASSKPYEAPRSRTGVYKKHIYYFYDKQQKSAVIGAVKLNGKKGDVPAKLEHGGDVRIGPKTYRVLPRPHMEPALKDEWATLVQRLKRL